MRKTQLFSALALLLTLATSVPRAVVAADPFYTQLLDRGVRDLEIGLADQAQQELRTACFGFLDEPALLAEGLMQLGRAQAKTGDGAALIETIRRLTEIETRFNVYSSFDGPLKAVFESSLRPTLPDETLARMPMFIHLAVATEPAPQEVRLLTPKQQRRALEQQLDANPDDADALLALGRMHYTNGKLKPASKLLDRLLATRPGDAQALCLRAEIAVARKECEPALAGLDSCTSLTASNQGAAFVLECLVSAERSSEAADLLERLPIERRQTPRIARAARKIDTSAGSLETPAEELLAHEEEPVKATPPESVDGGAQETEAVVFPEITIGFTLEERMRRLREEIAESRFREHLKDTIRHTAELADDYSDSPQAQHLAAEVAYLSSEWQAVLDYFVRGGRPSAAQPELLFYLAVATYELGNTQEAASILREALPALPRTPFVERYIDKILIPPAS